MSEPVYCSFCGASNRVVVAVVRHDKLAICDRCVDAVNDAMRNIRLNSPGEVEYRSWTKPLDTRPAK